MTIKQIKQILASQDFSTLSYEQICLDERKGVQNLVKQYQARLEKEQQIQDKYYTMNHYERQLKKRGCKLIAGVDEAGRGPLAGPVVAAACILRDDIALLGINDSKQVSKKNRSILAKQIKEGCLDYGYGVVSAKEIDKYNIYQAAKLAMKRALDQLEYRFDAHILDAMNFKFEESYCLELIKADAKSNSVAAASILAKTYRDELMEKYADIYPEFGFEKHHGYGTKEHLAALSKYGKTAIHRNSYEPVAMTKKTYQE